jgi:RhoGAP domain
MSCRMSSLRVSRSFFELVSLTLSFFHRITFLLIRLVQKGIYQQGLFRKLPNRERHVELIQLFSTPPNFGSSLSLRSETMPDICAVLSTYLTKLPEPILDKSLFRAIWAWSVKPSIKFEMAEKEKDEHEDDQFQFVGGGRRKRLAKLTPHEAWKVAYEKSLKKIGLLDRNEEEVAREDFQITIASLIIRMLPCANLSLLIYLLAFFTQIPLCPENGIQYEDLARLFGYKILGGPSHNAAYKMMIWLLVRWPRISEKLGVEDECCEPKEEVVEEVEEEEEEEEEGALKGCGETSSAEDEDGPSSTRDESVPADGSNVPSNRKGSDASLDSTMSGSTLSGSSANKASPPLIDEDDNEDENDEDSEMRGEDTVVLLPSEGLFELDKRSFVTEDSASIYSTRTFPLFPLNPHPLFSSLSSRTQ